MSDAATKTHDSRAATMDEHLESLRSCVQKLRDTTAPHSALVHGSCVASALESIYRILAAQRDD